MGYAIEGSPNTIIHHQAEVYSDKLDLRTRKQLEDLNAMRQANPTLHLCERCCHYTTTPVYKNGKVLCQYCANKEVK